MADLTLTIVTPQREVYKGPARDVTVPGWEGEFQVLAEHDMFLTLLRGGILEYTTSEGPQRGVVGRGFAEAGPDVVTILTDSYTSADVVDKGSAKADLEAATTALGNAADGTAEWDAASEKFENATARLNA